MSIRKLPTFYLFYALAFLLIIVGLLMNNFSFDYATAVVPGWHTTIFPNYLMILLPAALYSLIIGLLFQYRNHIGKPLSNVFTLAFFTITVFGLFLSARVLMLLVLVVNQYDFGSLAFGEGITFQVFFGPMILLVSIIFLIIRIFKTKQLK